MSPRSNTAFQKMQEDSQKKILKAAFELFAQKGFEATSVDAIAQKAKISKGLIYHYFTSKQDILKGLFSSLMQQLSQFMEGAATLSPSEYIEKMIEFSFHFILHQTKISRLMIALTIQPKIVSGFKEGLELAKQTWMKHLALMFKKLGYKQPDAEAYLLGAIFDGVSIGYQTFGKAYPILEIKQLITKKYNLKIQK